MIDSYIARDQALAGFGAQEVTPLVEKYETASSGHAVGGFSLTDCPAPYFTSWATVAMSFFDTGYRKGGQKVVGTELVGCASSEWKIFGRGLAFCAFYVADGGPSRPGTVISDAFRNHGQDVTTPHALLVPPFTWETELPAYEDDDIYVTWLQAVPITEAEAIFALARGGEALEDLFEAEQPDLYDLGRPSMTRVPAL